MSALSTLCDPFQHGHLLSQVSEGKSLFERQMHNLNMSWSWQWHPITFPVFSWLKANHRSRRRVYTRTWTAGGHVMGVTLESPCHKQYCVTVKRHSVECDLYLALSPSPAISQLCRLSWASVSLSTYDGDTDYSVVKSKWIHMKCLGCSLSHPYSSFWSQFSCHKFREAFPDSFLTPPPSSLGLGFKTPWTFSFQYFILVLP